MKYCKNCGAEISDEALACPQCGQPAEKGKQNVVGIVGLVLALLNIAISFVPLPPALSFITFGVWLAGLICSCVGISQAKKKNQKKNCAVAGLVLSLLGIGLIIILLIVGGAIIGGALGGALGMAALVL